MTISYPDIKPWGRSFDEYVRMFSLTPANLNRKILGCGDGPASFNAELTERGGNVISIKCHIYRSCLLFQCRPDKTEDQRNL